MCEVDKENETKKDEHSGADHGDVVAPEHEETIRDEEGEDDKDEPEQHFRTPPSSQAFRTLALLVHVLCHSPVLDSSSLVFRIFDSDENCTENQVEQREGETYPMHL